MKLTPASLRHGFILLVLSGIALTASGCFFRLAGSGEDSLSNFPPISEDDFTTTNPIFGSGGGEENVASKPFCQLSHSEKFEEPGAEFSCWWSRSPSLIAQPLPGQIVAVSVFDRKNSYFWRAVDFKVNEDYVEGSSDPAFYFLDKTDSFFGPGGDLIPFFGDQIEIRVVFRRILALPHTNIALPFDVNADGIVDAGDVAALNEEFEVNGYRRMDSSITSPPSIFVDVDRNLFFNHDDLDLLNMYLSPPHPWQNPLNRLDVDNNGVIAPVDIMLLQNLMTQYGQEIDLAIDPPWRSKPVGVLYADPSGDNRLTPLDVEMIINYLNSD
ncbi:MAG: hypothetical protein H6617_00840 [Bdellovibrionaceae bacterium]|nr:hypothetical protein [Bdellovibrionales bacterium]MCB9253213.1 hypothetical protein [Pseudobdellovibrionaceae bacterium]